MPKVVWVLFVQIALKVAISQPQINEQWVIMFGLIYLSKNNAKIRRSSAYATLNSEHYKRGPFLFLISLLLALS